MQFKEFCRWTPDSESLTTPAVVIVSECGTVVKRMQYLSVEIKGKMYSVHRIVALAFLPNPMAKEQVNHKDGNKQNNHLSNLEWSTNSENQRHARENGLIKAKVNKFCDDEIRRLYHKMRDEKIKCKDVKRKLGVTYETIMARFGREYEISISG